MRTGTLAFDPDAFVTAESANGSAAVSSPAPDVPQHDPEAWRRRLPKPWAIGLARLVEMPSPYGCPEDRWRQVVADALSFSRCFHDIVAECGWSLGNLFGYDTSEPGIHGLVLDIRGGRVIDIDERHAVIRIGDERAYNYRRSPDDSLLLWNVRRAVP